MKIEITTEEVKELIPIIDAEAFCRKKVIDFEKLEKRLLESSKRFDKDFFKTISGGEDSTQK